MKLAFIFLPGSWMSTDLASLFFFVWNPTLFLTENRYRVCCQHFWANLHRKSSLNSFLEKLNFPRPPAVCNKPCVDRCVFERTCAQYFSIFVPFTSVTLASMLIYTRFDFFLLHFFSIFMHFSTNYILRFFKLSRFSPKMPFLKDLYKLKFFAIKIWCRMDPKLNWFSINGPNFRTRIFHTCWLTIHTWSPFLEKCVTVQQLKHAWIYMIFYKILKSMAKFNNRKCNLLCSFLSDIFSL